MLHFPDPKLPVPQKKYTKEERNKFDLLIEQIQTQGITLVILEKLATDFTKEQETRFYQYCHDNDKIRLFRQACLDYHHALNTHATYLQENLRENKRPEGAATPQILQGLLDRRDNLLGMYARHIFKDISASIEDNSALQKKPPRPKSYPQ